MADITAAAREPMKSGRPHRAANVWATALVLAWSLSACGGASDSVQPKGVSTQASSTVPAGSTESVLASGAALSSAQLSAAEKAAVAAEVSVSTTPIR